MEDLTTELTTKLTLLEFTKAKSEAFVKAENVEGMERQRDTLRAMVRSADAKKVEIEQQKFAAGESADDVTTWSQGIDKQLAVVDASIVDIGKWLAEIELKEKMITRQSEDVLVERARKEQLEFERAQFELKLEYEKKTQVGPKAGAHKEQVKLPKLAITKFNGTYEEWLPFWNKFTAEIHNTNLAAVTKFAYLKELLEPRVRMEIDGLPFTTEGYERARNILASEYGKPSEIIHAYIQNIMSLPVITGSQPRKIHEFYKKLVYNVQSLETLGKLQDVAGNTRAVLDKLKGIKADLV